MEPLVQVGVGLLAGALVMPWVETPRSIAAAALVLSTILMFVLWRRSIPRFLVGISLGMVAIATLPPGPSLQGPLALQGVVVGAPLGREADVALSRTAHLRAPWQERTGRVRVRFPDRAPSPGTEVAVFGEARLLPRSVLPGAPDPVRAARRGRIRTWVIGRAAHIIGRKPDRMSSFGEGEHSGILRALATGDRSEVSQETWSLLRRTGTSHLLAISGFHVGLVAGAAFWLFATVLRAGALLHPRGFSLLPAWCALAIAGVAYAWFTGAPVSAQRAAGMAVLVALGRAQGREVRPLSLLAMAAIGVVIADPAAISTPSFQLSFGAVLGLVRVMPILEAWCPKWLPRPLTWAWRGMSTSIAATIGTLPAAAWWFQEVAPLSPLANLFAVPWVAFTVVPCAMLAAFGPHPLSMLGATLGDHAVGWLCWALTAFDADPLIVAVGPTTSLALAVVLLIPRRSVILVAAITSIVIQWWPTPAGTRVTFLDVGQGDAALVETVDGERWLIDAGPPRSGVLQWLRRRGTHHLDRVVISHAERDHIGGLGPILDNLTIDELWIGNTDGLEDLLQLAAQTGTQIRLAPNEALHPRAGFTGRSRNNRSLVVRAGQDPTQVLFTGDIERSGEAVLARDLSQPFSVLKVPHHGSDTSSTDFLLRAVQPQLAVVSVGRHNFYGHPHTSVLQRYRAHGIDVLRTDVHGTIALTLTDRGFQAHCHQMGTGWTTCPSGPPRRNLASVSSVGGALP